MENSEENFLPEISSEDRFAAARRAASECVLHILAIIGDVAAMAPILEPLLTTRNTYRSELDKEQIKKWMILLSAEVKGVKEKLEEFLKDPRGFILFEEITNLATNSSPTLVFIEERRGWMERVLRILKNTMNDNLEKTFEDNLYILGQISKMSPQALMLLSAYDAWIKTPLSGGTTMSGETLLGDWHTEAAKDFVHRKTSTKERVDDKNLVAKVGYTYQELRSANLVYLSEDKIVKLSLIGLMILEKLR